jgi:uncharacterized protein YycO
MSHLVVIYSRSRNLGSVLIRAASWWEPWAHCGIVTPEGTVIEARAWRGVVETPLQDFERYATACIAVKRACPDPAAAIAFARQQIGKPYDWGAIFGFIFRERWERRDRWFCSELVEASFIAGGRRRFASDVHRITPTMSFNVL